MGLRRSIVQKTASGASDVLTRSELLAMAPHGPRRVGERNVACLPFAVPIASLSQHVPPAPATQSGATSCGELELGLQGLELRRHLQRAARRCPPLLGEMPARGHKRHDARRAGDLAQYPTHAQRGVANNAWPSL